MRYTISIAVLNNLEMTRKCLACLEETTVGEWELIVSDNGSTDETPRFLREYQATHPHCRVITYPFNTGFGHPHNQALRAARGEYFVVLNNDIFIHEKGWIDTLARHFDSPRVALVGFAGNHSGITDELTGIKNPPVDEYVEASCLMIPRQLALRHGLFDPEYELAYFEDTDLSLRYRQKGYEFRLVECDYLHVNNATALTLDKRVICRAMTLNRETFRIRWGGYLQRRSFTSRILIRALAHPDLLLQTTPVIQALISRTSPVPCHLVTTHPDLFRGWPLERVDTPDEPIREEEYDRVITFDYGSLLPGYPAALSLALQARVRIDTLRPFIPPGNSTPTLLDPGNSGWLLAEESIADQIAPVVSDRSLVTATYRDDCRVDLSVSGRHDTIDLISLPSMLTGCRGIIGRPGPLLRVASSTTTPLLLFLEPSDDPLSLGFDPQSTLTVCSPWTHTDIEQLITTLLTLSPPPAPFPLQTRMLHMLFRELLIQSYYSTPDSQEDLQETLRATQEELLLARQEVASLRGSLSWRITEPLRRLHRLMTRGG